MIKSITHIRKVFVALAAMLLLFVNTATLAASSCKGLAKSKCESNAACTWVSGYTTEKGKKTSAYCRAKSGKSTKSSEKTSKKADKSKTSDKKTSKSTKESKKSSKADKDKKKAKSQESKGNTTK